MKLKVNDSYRKVEKITSFEPFNEADVVNKAYIDTKLNKIEACISHIQKDYDEFKMHKTSSLWKRCWLNYQLKRNYKYCMIKACLTKMIMQTNMIIAMKC